MLHHQCCEALAACLPWLSGLISSYQLLRHQMLIHMTKNLDPLSLFSFILPVPLNHHSPHKTNNNQQAAAPSRQSVTTSNPRLTSSPQSSLVVTTHHIPRQLVNHHHSSVSSSIFNHITVCYFVCNLNNFCLVCWIGKFGS